MTGTVLDGNVDLALLQTDGHSVTQHGPWALHPYPPTVRPLLAAALDAARAWDFDGPEPPLFAQAESALTHAQADAVRHFLATQAPAITPAIIGFHGQTVLHRPPAPGRPGRTRQLGDGPLMARLTGIDTAYDFRSADVAAGGHGAPLAPAYHAALLAALDPSGDTAILNLGGVANLTHRAPDATLTAFDTGPANAPINDWVERHTGAPMDRDGALARAGRVDEPRLARLLAHPHFAAPPPKSLDRFAFTADLAQGLSLQDGAATLTALAAAAVGAGLDLLPTRPTRLVVCGGGRRNPALLDALRTRAHVTPVLAESAGWRGDAIEAELFALLAVRTLRALPLSFPTTTGVPAPMTGGRMARAARPGPPA